MKTTMKLIGATLVISTTLTACHDDIVMNQGEGYMNISAKISTDVKVRSRASVEELQSTVGVFISNAKGVVKEYRGVENLPTSPVPLLTGSYNAEAFAGDSVPASFTDRYFKGITPFEIANGQTIEVTVTAKIANVAAKVEYAEDIDQVLTNCVMTVGTSAGTLDFVGNDDRTGYFMLSTKRPNLEYTLTGTRPNGETYTRSGIIENAQAGTLYTLNVRFTGDDAEIGGAFFTIDVQENPIVVEEEIIITLAPQIEGYDFNIADPIASAPGKIGRRSVLVYGYTRLTDVEVISDVIPATEIGGNDVNLLTMTPEVGQHLQDAGINFIQKYDAENDVDLVKINLEAKLLDAMSEGNYTFTVKATDANGKTSQRNLEFVITNAPVSTLPVEDYDVWATHAAVSGSIITEGSQPLIRYRKAGATDWTTVTPQVNGTTFQAMLSGLEPGTQYEYLAATASYTECDTYKFTTEAGTQLPNSSFENWSSLDGARVLYGDGEQMFWDSGNHGSKTMNKQVTDASTDKKHSGNYSAKLASQFVGVGALGAFAAGNVFVGKFLGTNGTNGILGWGRTFTSRPTSLTGYVHYTPAAVTHTKAIPGVTVNKGDMDQGIIYIAILDPSVKTYTTGGVDYNFPVIVKTKEQEFFSKDDPNVIAYGELVLTEATAGDDMVKFTIPLTYIKKNVKAANIAIVASASRYGDYFTGGDGSVMYLDDLQLVY